MKVPQQQCSDQYPSWFIMPYVGLQNGLKRESEQSCPAVIAGFGIAFKIGMSVQIWAIPLLFWLVAALSFYTLPQVSHA